MPLFIRWFVVAIRQKKTPGWVTPVGLGLLAALCAAEVGILWNLLP
jgi:hypothetical protein